MQKTAVVIGAGPGGAAAAVRLKQRGVPRVILLDKDTFPRDKTCGSGLSPNALKTIESLGIGAEVRRLGYPIHSLVLGTPGGRRMKLTTDAAAVVLLRKHFDNLIVEQAQKLGAEFKGGFLANELVRDGSGRVVGVRSRKGEEVRGDYVVMADGAHSIFSHDDRPKKTISAIMGWWEDYDYEPHTMEMFFDKKLSPLYGWMFPEAPNRVNIGICIDGEDGDGRKTQRKIRDVFDEFLRDNYADKLKTARQVGKWKGHPISYCTWIKDLDDNGAVYLGEGGRMTHNATGEGIFHAMQSGIWCADAVADILNEGAAEKQRLRAYTQQCRKRFTFGFMMGHVLRGAMKTPLFDWIADAYNNPRIRGPIASLLTTALVDAKGSDKTGNTGAVEREFAEQQQRAGGYQPITTFSQDDDREAASQLN
jgi:menaquinone-9 beta-reductase